MNDQDVKDMNRRIKMGWEPSRHQWQLVADRAKDMVEMRESKVWGIREVPWEDPGYKIVTNPQFFHPSSVVAQGLTYDEAKALLKILES